MALNMMIVDDSPVMRAFIQKVIALTGLETGTIYEAEDGEEALRLLRDNWVDLVLTDINMPRMNGEELIQHLESDDLMRTIPVLVVSTDSSEVRMRRLLALGARSYITKPFLPETLRDEVEKALGMRDA